MSLRYLSISQLSEVTGKDRRTISKRLAGVAVHSVEGRAQLYDAPEVIPLIMVQDSVKGLDKKILEAELGEKQARQAKLEIEVGKLRGELIPINEVTKAVEREYTFVRSKFRTIPNNLAKALSMLSDPTDVFNRLQEAVEEILTELVADAKFKKQADSIMVEQPLLEESNTDAKL